MSTLLANFASLKAAPGAVSIPKGEEPEQTERSKENTETIVQDPKAIKQMKKGPDTYTDEEKKTAPPAGTTEADLIGNVLLLETEIAGLTGQIKDVTKALNESKQDKEKKMAEMTKTLYEVMEANSRPLIKHKDQIVSIDKKMAILGANMSPAAKKKAEKLNADLVTAAKMMADTRKELETLTTEQFEKFGGKESEIREIAKFPDPSKLASAFVGIATLQGRAYEAKDAKTLASLSAGILDILKGFWKKLKEAFGSLKSMVTEAESLDKMLDSEIKAMK